MNGLLKIAGMKPLLISCAIPLVLMAIQVYIWKSRKNWNLAMLIVAFSLVPLLYSLHLTGTNTLEAYKALSTSSPENMTAVLSHGKSVAYTYAAVGTWLSGILLVVSGLFFAVALPLVHKSREVKNG